MKKQNIKSPEKDKIFKQLLNKSKEISGSWISSLNKDKKAIFYEVTAPKETNNPVVLLEIPDIIDDELGTEIDSEGICHIKMPTDVDHIILHISRYKSEIFVVMPF